MARLVLITGGCRSGKSEYALKLAETTPGPRAYVATCPITDDEEMLQRIRRHQKARGQRDWQTIEEPVDLAGVFRTAQKYNVLLVDCLTLWVNNLIIESESFDTILTEEDITSRCREILSAAAEFPGTIIFVTNEVGMGIVPSDRPSRQFRDLAGRCNQIIADECLTVTVMISGLPLHLKNEKQRSV